MAGGLRIGGGGRISIQTMWKKSLNSFTEKDYRELENLHRMGCDIIRFSVPDINSAAMLGEIKSRSPIPLVADIHFDHRLAIECINRGIDKIRINPGNIGSAYKVREVLSAADANGVPIRIGINSGSLPESVIEIENKAEAMIAAAENEIDILEKAQFKNAVFSLKASGIDDTIAANIEFSKRYDYPLHIGITEAGPRTAGIVKTSIAFYRLLKQQIGDTIRVSLTDSCQNEVITAREILKACGLYDFGISIISCPRCGRSTFDTHKFIDSISEELYLVAKPIKAAVMGCVVNGPGEAADADIGITGIGNKAVLFKHGKIYTKVDENNSKQAFLQLLDEIINEV